MSTTRQRFSERRVLCALLILLVHAGCTEDDDNDDGIIGPEPLPPISSQPLNPDVPPITLGN